MSLRATALVFHIKSYKKEYKMTKRKTTLSEIIMTLQTLSENNHHLDLSRMMTRRTLSLETMGQANPAAQ